MPKRRKNNTEEVKEVPDLMLKRRRRGSPPSQYDSVELCQELYDRIRNYKCEDGRLLCDSFVRCSKRRNSVDQCDVVSTPIDLLKIQLKLKNDEYEDVDQMSSDVELMVSNAKLYYKKNSQEFKDTIQFWEVFQQTKNQLLNVTTSKIKEDLYSEAGVSNDSSLSEVSQADSGLNKDCLLRSTPSNVVVDENPLEELFAAVMTAADLDGRVFSTSIQLLPSRRRNAEYYKKIQEPMDLKMIATKIQNNSYQNLNELEQDLLLIIKNVKACNLPGSQNYKDAVALRRVITSKKLEIEHGRASGSKTSERIRQKRLAGGQRLSAITAALQYESDMEDPAQLDEPVEEEEEEDTVTSDPKDANSPQWQLYEAVRQAQSPQGYPLCEQFLRLVSRRRYPDYYKEIKHPISLLNIGTKLKNGTYTGLNEVVDDMNLMFDNAKSYNRADSKIYKDAVKLQKIMQTAAKELVNVVEKGQVSEDEDDRSEKSFPKRQCRKSFPLGTEERKKVYRRNTDAESGIKKRMKALYKALVDFVDETGRPLITHFMEKPSKKNYPDYYQVIVEPIDMKTIDHNIRSDKYEAEEALISDFHLMFNNCRQYNEENSQIYRDAQTLDKVLFDKVQELAYDSPKLKIIAKKSKVKASPQMTQRLRTMFDSVKDHTDKGRKLSPIFAKLPSRTDYPDYYEIIKRPIDMQKIQTRLNVGHYANLDELLADLVLMFDNACKYNEPDSQIYKDALTLQRVALQTKMELSEEEDGAIPDVRPLVQELLTSLFTYVYNHEDEEGRCYSDSLAELSETRATDQDGSRILTLDMIKKNLNKGYYRRLDAFQEDMFEVFQTACRISRTDSQVFEDSVELHSYFIKMRDELCKNGELLSSPALRYAEKELQTWLEMLRIEKLPKENYDDENDKEQELSRSEKEQRSLRNNSDSVNFREQTYHVGDFVYIEPREKGLEPHIIHIDKLWKDDDDEQWLYGCWFYRPNETFHLATRKFLEKEVFKSDNYNSAPMNQVLGKCYVMFVKDYFKYKPEGFEDKDVYVCESRYSAKAKAFKKIKIWPFCTNHHVRILQREMHLTPTRVPSVFKERLEKHKEDSMDVDDFPAHRTEVEKPNVVLITENLGSEENILHYEQFNIPTGRYKLGDCVYVRSENGRQLIACIDRMWEEKGKGSFFHGPWFVTPQEITHPPTRLFHKQEVFLSSIEDTNPLLSITGRCYVMELKDYVRCRPTEIPEQDVYICESRYLEAERQIRKLTKGLKKFILSPSVFEDEIYFFKKPISTQIVSSVQADHGAGMPIAIKSKSQTSSEPSPLPKASDTDMEDSNDGHAPSAGSSEACTPNLAIPMKKKPIRRLVTGYILYSGEVRKSVITRNPNSTFGDISRMVGTEWRALPSEVKADYEERAQKLNEESAANQSQVEELQLPGLPENTVFECHWDKCTFQFEDQHDLVEHLIGDGTGHVQTKYGSGAVESGEFLCLWDNCPRMKKNMPPFQNIHRLIRHCKDVHARSCSRLVLPADRGINYVPSQRLHGNRSLPAVQGYPAISRFSHQAGYQEVNLLAGQTVSPGISTVHHQYGTPGSKLNRKNSLDIKDQAKNTKRKKSRDSDSTGTPANVQPAGPMFVATPPKPQKLLHSEAYLRYMEGLQPDNRTITNWDSSLKATQENTPLLDSGRLPVHWLGNGVGNHGNVVNALWALRDYMLRDALNISKLY